jgi:hypothetical protein
MTIARIKGRKRLRPLTHAASHLLPNLLLAGRMSQGIAAATGRATTSRRGSGPAR